MKWISKILYLVAVLFLGYMFFASASVERIGLYYSNDAIPHLANNELNDYVNKTMISLRNKKYIENAIYEFNYSDETLSFNVNINHFQGLVKDELKQGMLIYVHNVEFKDLSNRVKDYDNYLLDKTLVKLNMKLLTNAVNNFYEQQIVFNSNELAIKGGSFTPIYFDTINNKDAFAFIEYQEVTKSLNEITRIEFSIVDETVKDLKETSKPFAIIYNNDLSDEYFFQSKTFVKNESNVITSTFNGNPSSYKVISEEYNNNTYVIKTVDLSAISKYNNVILRSMLIYSLFALAITYLLFFLNPTIEYFKKRKNKMTK